MVRIIFVLFLIIATCSCGVKKAPVPLYSIPDTALKITPTPSPAHE